MKSVFLLVFFFTSNVFANLQARIITDSGVIVVNLLVNSAPKTVENFVKLATGEQKYIDTQGNKSNKPFYDGLKIHRAHPDLGIFSGCPWGTGRGWPGYYMFDESPERSVFYEAGFVAMAKVPGDNRVGSQFFITVKPEERFNGKYTIFGKVVSGMDVVHRIASAPIDPTLQPSPAIFIKKIEIVR